MVVLMTGTMAGKLLASVTNRSIGPSSFIDFCMSKLQLLLAYNVKPIMVFDGGRLPMKQHQESLRHQYSQIRAQVALLFSLILITPSFHHRSLSLSDLENNPWPRLRNCSPPVTVRELIFKFSVPSM